MKPDSVLFQLVKKNDLKFARFLDVMAWNLAILSTCSLGKLITGWLLTDVSALFKIQSANAMNFF